MISRIWHGWTSPTNADRYEDLLRKEVFVAIEERAIPGLRGIDLLRRQSEDEVEFVTIMWFDSFEAVRSFAGPDYQRSVVPPRARELLMRYDDLSQHYEVRERGVAAPVA